MFESYVLSEIRKQKTNKQTDKHVSTVTLGLVYTKCKPNKKPKQLKTIRILLDSGSSGTIINQHFVKRLQTTKTTPAKWKTKAGSFQTNRKATVTFLLYELHKHRKITWPMYIDENSKDKSNYDMIIGRDLLHEVGIDLLFSTKEIAWDDSTIAMRDPDQLKPYNIESLENEIFLQEDIDTETIQRMTETKYAKADLPKEVDKCDNLLPEQKKSLLRLLEKYKTLFEGGSGTGKQVQLNQNLRKDVNRITVDPILCHTLKKRS